jgi:outer membrane lipoprotein carrier protein
MTKILLVLWLGLSSLSVHAQDTVAVDDLLAALANTVSVEGEFVQRQYGEDNELLGESSGHFRLLRPGYFAWEILKPDNQLIIAGPQYLWHYDKDLDTVTRRPAASGAQMTPLQILGGDEAALRREFQVVNNGEGKFTLTPKARDVGFKQLSLRFEQARIAGMEIRDNLDQKVIVELTVRDANAKLSADDFAFSPPPGSDTFYYDE